MMTGEVKWIAESVRDGHVLFRLGRLGSHLIAEWPGRAVLRSDPDGSWHALDDRGSSSIEIEKLRVGASALIAHLRGEVTLHASAASKDGSAIALLGDSGAGKSTLAFALAQGRGWTLLSDDMLRVSGDIALPSEARSGLDENARGHFQLNGVAKPNVALVPARLRSVVLLTFHDGPVEIHPLTGARLATVLMGALIRFVVDDPATNAADLNRLADLARSVRGYELLRPKTFVSFDRTVELVDRCER